MYRRYVQDKAYEIKLLVGDDYVDIKATAFISHWEPQKVLTPEGLQQQEGLFRLNGRPHGKL